MLLRGYDPKLPVFDKPIYFDNPVDPRAYLFVFRDENGKVIGTVSRFAAHPDVAVLFEHLGGHDYHYDYDWPGYLSEKWNRNLMHRLCNKRSVRKPLHQKTRGRQQHLRESCERMQTCR